MVVQVSQLMVEHSPGFSAGGRPGSSAVSRQPGETNINRVGAVGLHVVVPLVPGQTSMPGSRLILSTRDGLSPTLESEGHDAF